jgi:hypothetical protein
MSHFSGHIDTQFQKRRSNRRLKSLSNEDQNYQIKDEMSGVGGGGGGIAYSVLEGIYERKETPG